MFAFRRVSRRTLSCLALLLLSAGAPVGAQTAAVASTQATAAVATENEISYATSPVSIAQYNPLTGAALPSKGFVIGPGWIISPELLVAGVYSDNIEASSVGRIRGLGMRLRPSVAINADNGIHKTTVFATGDFEIYNFGQRANVFGFKPTNRKNGIVRLDHIWEVQRDLIVRLEGQYLHGSDLFGAIVGSSLVPTFSPQITNQLYGGAYAEKALGNYFIGLGFNALRQIYGGLYAAPTPVTASIPQSALNNNQYTAVGRAGYKIGPDIYVFAEPSGNFRAYDSSIFGNPNSEGFRVIGGLGATRFSLFGGEVYAGYMAQNYRSALIPDTRSAAFGGRLTWDPTRDLQFSLQVDRQLPDSTVATGSQLALFALTPVTSSKATLASLNATYKSTDFLTFYSRSAIGEIRFPASWRLDRRYLGLVGMNYTFWRNVSLTAEYQFTRLSSNFPLIGYSQNLVTVGATVRY